MPTGSADRRWLAACAGSVGLGAILLTLAHHLNQPRREAPTPPEAP